MFCVINVCLVHFVPMTAAEFLLNTGVRSSVVFFYENITAVAAMIIPTMLGFAFDLVMIVFKF
jgi:hypothetical protein